LSESRILRSAEQEKNLSRPAPSADTTKVWVRVHEGIRSDLEAWVADPENNAQKHEVLRAIIKERLKGGRARRTEEKLASVVDTAEGLLAEVNPNSEDGLTHREKVTLAIASNLGEAFDEETLSGTIDAETSGSDYYHEEYAPRVIEHKGVRWWEKQHRPDVFLALDVWDAKMTTEILRNLGGTVEGTGESPPPPFTKAEFTQAAKAAGIEESDWNRETANKYRERVLDRIEFAWNPETERFEPGDGDTPDAPHGRDTEEPAAEAEMDALMAAEVATDGGRDRP